MVIKKFIVGPLATNVYLVYHPADKQGVLIDPAFFDQRITEFIVTQQLQVKYLLLTHGHFDHISGAAAFKKELGARICWHPADLEIISVDNRGRAQHLGFSFAMFQSDIELADNQQLLAGELDFTVLHTPGHTPGSVCFYEAREKVLFSGDTIFKGSYGRTDFPGGDEQQLWQSIKNKILTLPDDIKIYPGHGEGTKVEAERNLFI